MEKYIDTKQNLVVFDYNKQINIDCSALSVNGIVFVGKDEQGFWIEFDPFVGKKREVPTELINNLFNQAENTYLQNVESNKPTVEQLRIIELKQKLFETDYKDLPSYDKRNTEEWNNLMQQRQSWRDELRNLTDTL
jgi:hypothetical protein